MIEFMVKLQEIRTPFLNKVVELITITGEEMVLIAVMCIVFWCISREHGYKMILSIVFASALNAALKAILNVPRPWTKDDRLIPIRQETATSSSMPSGHTQVGSSMWFSLSRSFENGALRAICYVMMILIAFSRVYLSVHTPQDVLAALALAVVGVIISHSLVNSALRSNSPMAFAVLALLAFVGLFFFKTESYYKMTGLLLALPLAFFLENKFIKFSAKGNFLKQIFKVIIGFAVVMIFKEGLKFVFPDNLTFELIRYFIVGIAAIYLVPLIFVSLKLADKEKKEV